MARVYATHQELINYTEGSDFVVPTEPESQRVRGRASEVVDEGLLTAIYDTDPVTERPTNAQIAVALRDAVCAQVVWWDETGDEHGVAGQYTSASIGTMALVRGGNGGQTGGPAWRVLAPQAFTHLRLAGLLPGAVTG